MGRTFAALAIALAALAPTVLADHVFSHRLYIVGRVVDAEGAPAAGVPVSVEFAGLEAGGKCWDSKAETTGPRGDYEICRHAHQIPQNVRATIRAGGAVAEALVDPDVRHASASLQLPARADVRDVNGERIFARTFHVSGRAFALLAKAENAEGVHVNATPLLENVTVELRDGERVVANATKAPDEHGRYQVDLDVEAVPAGAIVRVRAGPDLAEEPASALFRRADLNVVRDLRLREGFGEGAPGTGTPGAEVPGPGLALVGAIALAALATARRVRK